MSSTPCPRSTTPEPATGAGRAGRTVGLVLVLVAVAALTLAVRWHWAAHPQGPAFAPRPDALEYAAAAQSLRHGDYALQVGPVAARPRYAPGWPLVLAVGLELGVEPVELWRLAGLFDALLAALLAFLAAALADWLGRRRRPEPSGRNPGRSVVGPGLAALLAGTLWALAPASVWVGRVVLSDAPALLAQVTTLTAWSLALFAPVRRPARLALAATAGGLAVATLALRPPDGVLLLLPLGVLTLGAGTVCRAALGDCWGRRRLRSTVLAALAAAALGLALVAGVLVQAGHPAWEWTDYERWVDVFLGPDASPTFAPEHALAGNPRLPRRVAGEPVGHLEFQARCLLGLPGLRPNLVLGPWWPLLGWLAAAGIAVVAWRRRGPARWLVLALGLWILERTVTFALYHAAAPRFYLPVATVAVVALAGGLGGWLGGAGSRNRPRRRVLALVAGLAGAVIVLVQIGAFQAFQPIGRGKAASKMTSPEEVQRSLDAWATLPPEERARSLVPFDPVHAQALGLLDAERAAQLEPWGPLPPTDQVVRVRGMVEAGLVAGPAP